MVHLYLAWMEWLPLNILGLGLHMLALRESTFLLVGPPSLPVFFTVPESFPVEQDFSFDLF